MPKLTETAHHFPLVKTTQGLYSGFLEEKKKAHREEKKTRNHTKKGPCRGTTFLMENQVTLRAACMQKDVRLSSQ